MVHTVLILDGDPAQRTLLSHSLRNRLGYQTVAAATLEDALRAFHTDPLQRPDLILLDWQGFAAPEQEAGFKALCAKAPLIALVKYGDYDSALAALRKGAQDFLAKPVAMERLNTSFRNLLLLRDARREADRFRRDHNGDPVASLPRSPFVNADGSLRRMEEIEADAIRFAMQHYHGRMTEVARKLGIGRSTLYRKLNGLGLRQEEAA